MRFIGSLSIILFLGVFSCQNKKKQEIARTSIYIAPHADDWQLFMGENAHQDLNNPKTKALFILVTAGDAAKGTSTDSAANLSYYKARERGFVNAISWATQSDVVFDDEGRAELALIDYSLETTIVNGHQLQKYINGNAVAYVLNLPDGFPQGQYQWSLQKLYENEIDSMPAIDQSAVYASWQDLRMTVKGIYEKEVIPNGGVILNVAERDSLINPGDHSDHLFASLLGEQAAHALNPTIRYYQEYVNLDKEINLSREQADAKRLVFSANALSKEHAGYASPWDERHTKFLERSYWREVKPKH